MVSASSLLLYASPKSSAPKSHTSTLESSNTLPVSGSSSCSSVELSEEFSEELSEELSDELSEDSSVDASPDSSDELSDDASAAPSVSSPSETSDEPSVAAGSSASVTTVYSSFSAYAIFPGIPAEKEENPIATDKTEARTLALLLPCHFVFLIIFILPLILLRLPDVSKPASL